MQVLVICWVKTDMTLHLNSRAGIRLAPTTGRLKITAFKASILFAKDEELTLNLLGEVLTGANFQVEAVSNEADAVTKLGSFDPNSVVTDLNFGIIGPSGADLLLYIEKEQSCFGKMVLTSHASPALVVPNKMALPQGVTNLVKLVIGSISDFVAAVENSISNIVFECVKPILENNRILLMNATQVEILKFEGIYLDVDYGCWKDGLYVGSSKTSEKLLLPRWFAHEVRAMTPDLYCTPYCLL